MFITSSHSADFDPERVVDPDRRGAVAWDQFNESFERLQATPWWRINRGRRYGPGRRLARLAAAFVVQRRDAIVDLRGKSRALFRFRDAGIPRDPDVVFFGAEAGWEALIVQALYGRGGRCVLIDSDPAAFERFRSAPAETRIPAPRGFGERELVIVRDPDRIEYRRGDLFAIEPTGEFDVGIDWGLIEHFDDPGKMRLLEAIGRFLRPGGLEISSCPRDTFWVRSFYRAFRDELNYGYRELLTLDEHKSLLRRGGFEVVDALTLPAHNVALARSSTGPRVT